MSSIISSKIHSPDLNLLALLKGEQKVIPPVPRGSSLNAKNWEQESALRMFLNHAELSVTNFFGKLPAYEYEDMVDWLSLRENL